jgi:hypothetical protein
MNYHWHNRSHWLHFSLRDEDRLPNLRRRHTLVDLILLRLPCCLLLKCRRIQTGHRRRDSRRRHWLSLAWRKRERVHFSCWVEKAVMFSGVTFERKSM